MKHHPLTFVDCGKSIPVHCVVMNTTTPCYLSDALVSPATAESKGSGPAAPGSAPGDDVDVDSYAIVPASTLFTQIVPVVLRKLGYSDDVIFNANGWLMLKNWRPLSLTQIAGSERETVGGVLGELTTVATLRIYIRKSHYGSGRSEASHVAHNDVKNKVLRWLMSQSRHLISSSRFPLDEKWQQKVMRGERPSTPSSDAKRQFDAWFQHEMSRPCNRPADSRTSPPSLVNVSARSSAAALAPDKAGSNHGIASPVMSHDPLSVPDLAAAVHHHHHQQQQQHRADGLPPRVRMRTTFDPEQELPRLQRWFSENQHPTRFQLQLYVQELNELESRRGRKPLDVSNLVYWFKNARAAYKRAETRTTSRQAGDPTIGGDTCWPAAASSAGADDGSDAEGPRESEAASIGENDRGRHDDELDDETGAGADDSSSKSCCGDGAVKSEPLDLYRNDAPADLSPNRETGDAHHHRHHQHEQQQQEQQQDSMTTSGERLNRDEEANESGGGSDDVDDDDDDASCDSRESDDDEDYAENLSLSKHYDDSKKSDAAALGAGQSDYAAAAAAAAAAAVAGYPAFPLAGFNSQLNPHGLVYMSSPYLQGIGSSLLHPSGSGSSHHLHHHHHQQQQQQQRAEPLGVAAAAGSGSGSHGGPGDDRRKRNRTFIDPVTEVPRLEHWFSLNTHPSHSLVLRYTDELNRQPYRLKFPKLEPKNVQFWFKNRRAKCKRLKLSL